MEGQFSRLREEEHDISAVYPPPTYPQPMQPVGMTNMSSSNTNVVSLQPMGGQGPQTIQVTPPAQANDHLWFTIAVVFLCLLTCNIPGVFSLIPAIICATMAADYNKEGLTDKARSLGTMAFVYDLVIICINFAFYALFVLISIIVGATAA